MGKKKAKKADASQTTAQSLSLVKSCRDIMRKDKGLNGDLDRLPMLTWIMFLKFLDDMERLHEAEAELGGDRFRPLIKKPYRWRDWASPDDGLTGPELIAFVNQEKATRSDGKEGAGLFAHLRGLQSPEGSGREEVVANVFRGVSNRMESGYLLRDVLNKVDGIHFDSTEEIHTLSRLYETMLREMRDAAGDSGEFYTPRPVVQFMVEALDPQLSETVLDPACGTGGFLVEAFDHMSKQVKTAKDRKVLHNGSLLGQEAKPLPYLLCEMNLLLHGLESPQIDYGNSLALKVTEIGDRDRVDVILTNPPFGGEEETSIKNGFPQDMQTAETALLSRGVALNGTLHQCVGRIEEHNSKLQQLAAAIPAGIRSDLTVDKFCALTTPSDIDEQLQAAERGLAALKQSDAIQKTAAFPDLSLPAIDLDDLAALLHRDIDDLSSDALAAVQGHVATLGGGGEDWLAAGMPRVANSGDGLNCPFCGQALSGSHLSGHIQGYFGQSYRALKGEIAERQRTFSHSHSDEAPAAFERAVRVVVERRAFWSQFCEVPEVSIDTAEIARSWKEMREQIQGLLRSKQQSPLDRIDLPSDLSGKVAAYNAHRDAIGQLSKQLQGCREAIDAVKEQAGAGNLASVEADLAKLRAAKQRSELKVSTACDAYLAEKDAKKKTETARDDAKEQLRTHRETTFPKYEAAINGYLQKFNANFRLSSVKAADTRGGPTCNYGVLVNSSTDPIDITAPAGQGPSFKTALSSGDRNTLALALFLSSIDDQPNLADLVVVIDDPINSLDDHRTVATAIEVRKLLQRVTQAIVLSHSKPFLCRLWEGTENSERAAYELRRSGAGSVLASWDVTQDCVTEHDKRHVLLESALDDSPQNLREVARAIRPHLEAYCRVAFPRWFPPGTLIGPFCGLCEQRRGQTDEILSKAGTDELKDIKDYANRYHHDTNPSWETESINETELVGYVRRALAFIRRA